MNAILKRSILKCSPVIDLLLLPLSVLSALYLRFVRAFGVCYLPIVRKGLEKVGIFPLRYHYYENLFYKKDLLRPLTEKRDLPGVDLNSEEQLTLLKNFHYQDELSNIPVKQTPDQYYYYSNPFFRAGDGEMLYNMIRHLKPKRIYEIGCGYSTHLAQKAIAQNQLEDKDYQCHHVCIEPFEHPELETLDVQVMRCKVETLNPSFFDSLEANDILFIDSSHSIRAQGDVLFNIQRILPRIAKGVVIQVHDIFTPRDYHEGSLIQSQIFWNEQYLLEAFLTFNPHYKVIAANHYLYHDHRQAMIDACPNLAIPQAEGWDWDPCSFWIQKTQDTI